MIQYLRTSVFYISILILFFLQSSCDENEKIQEAKTKKDTLNTQKEAKNIYKLLQELEKDMQRASQKATDKREERIRKGDTIAINDQDLRGFLPKKILNYLPTGDFVGSKHQLSGKGYSNAEQSYIYGDKHLRITLIDYNAGASPHAELVAFWDKGLVIDNQNEKAGKVVLKNKFKAWEVYLKRKKQAEIQIAVSDRIFLTIIADQQKNTTFIKYVAEKMDLSELAKK